MEKTSTIASIFDEVKDPRVASMCDHLLSDILLIALCTYITGGEDYQDMCVFGKERAPLLKGTLFQLPNGSPSADTFERIFRKLEPEALRICLDTYRKNLIDSLAEKQIVLDGKKLKGVSPDKKGFSGLYVLNAWVSENSVCVGQERVEDKSNEITAIPKVLDSLDIEDSVVTIDAIGTQTKIAEQIRSKKGNYLLSVKANQKELLEDVECAFKTNRGSDSFEELDYGHGRIETRHCSILKASDFLLPENITPWKDLTTLVKLESTREMKGKVTKEIRYYISNENIDKARYYSSLIRGHWSIENILHWHLDVTFKEDKCRARTDYAPENLTSLRKMSLQIILNTNAKLSLAKKQYKAALDPDFMKKILLNI